VPYSVPSPSGYTSCCHDNISSSTLVEIDQRDRGFYCSTIKEILVIGAVSTPGTSVNFYENTRHNVPGDSHLQPFFVSLFLHLPDGLF
jgi:hypothetical protein